MTPLPEIPQLLIVRTADGPAVVARGDGLEFAIEEWALRTAVAYVGDAEVPGDFRAVFALPANPQFIAVAAVEAPPPGDAGFVLAMRFLFLAKPLYRWIGDPFEIAERFPMNAAARGRLPTLAWPDELRPRRRVEDLQAVLKHGDSPLLLGAVQALLDGTMLRFTRPRPDRTLIRGLWSLLPDSSRGELWPCDFSLHDTLPFHAAVLPNAVVRRAGVIDEEQTKDYPAGRYEAALQVAVEAGDQTSLDALLARRAPRDVLRMALAILAFGVLLLAAGRLFR